MKRITKHGQTVPTSEQLLPYQEGYVTADHKYGGHNGKELFINDNGIIRPITQGYLNEEFINYAQFTDADGNIISEEEVAARTIYEKDESGTPLYGLGTNPKVDKTVELRDENGNTWGNRVAITTRVINTKEHKYQDQTYYVNSVNPAYIQYLKNSIEQKALFVVPTLSALNHKMHELSSDRKLEIGVQFIVKQDESHNNDTTLYAVTGNVNPDATYTNVDNDPTTWEPFKAYETVQTESGTSGTEISYNVKPEYVMELNYQYHDPVLHNEDGGTAKTNGLGLYIGNKDEEQNTIQLGLNKETTDDIKVAIEDATTYDDKNFGAKTADIDVVPSVVLDSVENNATWTNYIKLHTKTLNEDGTITSTPFFVDFNDFILDEGTWDGN